MTAVDKRLCRIRNALHIARRAPSHARHCRHADQGMSVDARSANAATRPRVRESTRRRQRHARSVRRLPHGSSDLHLQQSGTRAGRPSNDDECSRRRYTHIDALTFARNAQISGRLPATSNVRRLGDRPDRSWSEATQRIAYATSHPRCRKLDRSPVNARLHRRGGAGIALAKGARRS